jgi:hypothetical protein
MSTRPDPSVLVRALGAGVVKQLAAQGEGRAQFSQGCMLMLGGGGNVGLTGAGGSSPVADVGLVALATYVYRVAH